MCSYRYNTFKQGTKSLFLNFQFRQNLQPVLTEFYKIFDPFIVKKNSTLIPYKKKTPSRSFSFARRYLRKRVSAYSLTLRTRCPRICWLRGHGVRVVFWAQQSGLTIDKKENSDLKFHRENPSFGSSIQVSKFKGPGLYPVNWIGIKCMFSL